MYLSKALEFVSSLCFVAVLSLSLYTITCSGYCNEAVCGSIVSKCMLTQSCKCDAKNITCGKDCYLCLDLLFAECCECVEMCPRRNKTDTALSMKSHVGDLEEPFPDLFNVLTEVVDGTLRWISYTYPVEVSFITIDKEVKFVTNKGSEISEEFIPVNCTVAYMSQCMSWNKCRSTCASMGASNYRWFHDGCCECVGSTCLNYGINESRCLDCPPYKEELTPEEQNIISKDFEKLDEDFSEDSIEETTDSLIEREEESIDKMQNIDS